jgi:hypothetical protein
VWGGPKQNKYRFHGFFEYGEVIADDIVGQVRSSSAPSASSCVPRV